MPKRKQDANQKAALLVQAVTGTKPPKGEDLLGSEELKRQLREAKQSEARRTRQKG